MVKKLVTLLTLLCTLSLPISASRKSDAKANEPKAYVDVVLSPDKVVAGLSTVYSVVVYSTVPEILRVELAEAPSFGTLKARDIRLGRGSDTYLGEKKEKGETWYGFVVDNAVLTPDSKGNFTIKGGTYNICLGVEGYADDWFWGRRRTTVPHWIEASAPDIKLSVGAKPADLKDGVSYSVGDFKCEWSVPPGDIHEGSRAVAVYRVYGEGTLDEDALPDFKSSFGEALKVVYVKPQASTYMKGTTLFSEMEILVEFVPQEFGDVTLPRPSFSFIDPRTGKVKTCLPDKAEIKVKADSRPASSKAPVYEI